LIKSHNSHVLAVTTLQPHNRVFCEIKYLELLITGIETKDEDVFLFPHKAFLEIGEKLQI